MPIDVLGVVWADVLGDLAAGATKEFVVCSPYITRPGVNLLTARLGNGRMGLRVTVLTDLSPENRADGSTDPAAQKVLVATASGVCIAHLQRLHAKVYVRDRRFAIVSAKSPCSVKIGKQSPVKTV